MGACDISFTIGKKATAIEVKSYFERQKAQDRERNGHAEGYSGDFQTVDRVECHFSVVFASKRAAMDYCLEKASKWDYAIAVHYVELGSLDNKSTRKIEERLKAIQSAINKLDEPRKCAFSKCSQCGSKLNNSHLRRATCPLCGNCLRTDAQNRKRNKLLDQFTYWDTKLKAMRDAAQKKAFEQNKNKNVKTLVAGWGAC